MNISSNESLEIKIDNYSGPLEVLLDLAKSQKVNLADISITQLANQFIEFIDRSKKINLDIASEYFSIVCKTVPLLIKADIFFGCEK